MAKKKKGRRGARKPAPGRAGASPGTGTAPRRVMEGLEWADQLMKKKRWTEAREVLEGLDRRYPGQPVILTDLANVYYELEDSDRHRWTLERLLQADPDNPEAALMLAAAYLHALRPALALRVFRTFVERWPDHEYAADARETVADLEEMMPDLLAEMGIADDEAAWELAVQHEALQEQLAQNDFPQLRRAADAIIRRHPHFAPAYNNLSLAHWIEGRPDRAIETAEQVLTFAPDNVHALSNLVRFLCLSGQRDEALSYAERLRVSSAPAADKLLKQVEAFSYLGDDAAVWALFDAAAGTEERDVRPATPVLYHLAAVAAWHLGYEDEARRLWKETLKIQPGFDVARENLDDLRRPVGERHAPWAFSLSGWIGQKAWTDLERTLKSAASRKREEAAAAAIRRYLRQHLEMTGLLPALLERGSPQGRELAVQLIRWARTPELLEALKTFALGTHGPDQMRIEAANFLSQEGVLPTGPVRMHVADEWKELLLMTFEIGDESEDDEGYTRPVEELMEQATLALHDGDWERAEPLLHQALALQPDLPSLLNNLAVAYQMQGRGEEAEALSLEIHARHPDYLFARVNLARKAIAEGDTERAHGLLDPLLQRKKLHFSEFDSLCPVLIDLHLAEGNRDAASSWFDMWESADPENPQLMPYRIRLSRLGRALSRFRRGPRA